MQSVIAAGSPGLEELCDIKIIGSIEYIAIPITSIIMGPWGPGPAAQRNIKEFKSISSAKSDPSGIK